MLEHKSWHIHILSISLLPSGTLGGRHALNNEISNIKLKIPKMLHLLPCERHICSQWEGPGRKSENSYAALLVLGKAHSCHRTQRLTH